MEENQKPKRAKTGGRVARPAAEHKQLKGPFRFAPDVAALLDSLETGQRTAYLEAAVRYYHARPE